MKSIFLKILLFLPIISPSQIKKDSYTVYINNPDHTIKADVASIPPKIKLNQQLIYYWYSSNKIHETKGGFDGKVLNGQYTSLFLSGNLREKGQFKKGLKNGEWITWYDDGKIQSIKNWKTGFQRGVYKVYDIKGNLILEENYKNGMLNGEQLFIENGKIVSSKRFKNGKEILPKEKKLKDAEKEDSKNKKNIFSSKKKKKEVNAHLESKPPEKKKPSETKPAEEKEKNGLKTKFQNFFQKKDKELEGKGAGKEK